jgi:hypothetical protein
MDYLTQILESRMLRLEADLAKARALQDEMLTSLGRANAIVAEMQEARIASNARWAALLDNAAK